MAELEAEFSKAFQRDYKAIARKRDVAPLHEVFALILENSLGSRGELVRRHGMHTLSGRWGGSSECHVCNAGDWLLVWRVRGGTAVFQRTGTHDQIFRNR